MNVDDKQGDLTDVKSWERAWSRPLNRGRSRVKALLVENNEIYHAFFGHVKDAGTRPLEVLEVGCAPGKMLRNMARVAPTYRYSGVDFAPDALERTRQFLTDSGLDVNLHLADVRSFAPSVQYDLVLSFGLVEHFERPQDILAHHVRLVRPGGVVGITVPNYRHPMLKRALSIYSPKTLATHNLEVMSKQALTGMLEDVGLVDVIAGNCGGAIAPVARIEGTFDRGMRLLVTAWNTTFRLLPRSLSPWQGYFWACGRRAQ